MKSIGLPTNILFLCVANSARSQLAEGLAKALFKDQACIESAGSVPSGIVQPCAVTALQEIGIDIRHHYSKSINELPTEFLASIDYVITLCAEEVCPVLPSSAKARKLHWPIKDPAAVSETEKPEAFRMARNEIQKHLENFINDLQKQI